MIQIVFVYFAIIMYVFDGFKHDVVADGANGYVVTPTKGVVVKYTALQVFSFKVHTAITCKQIRAILDRGPYLEVEDADFPNGLRIIRLRMYGPYPVKESVEALFATIGLELIEMRTDIPKTSETPFLPIHKSFPAAYVSAPGVIVMTDGGDPLALPWEDKRVFDKPTQQSIMETVVEGVLHTLRLNIPLIDLKPDNVVYNNSNALIVDTDSANIADDESLDNHTSLRCAIPGGNENRVLACLIGLAVVAAVVHGIPYKDIVQRHHYQAMHYGTLKDLQQLLPEFMIDLKHLLVADVTKCQAESSLQDLLSCIRSQPTMTI